MSLREAISRVIAGGGVYMLLPALFAFVLTPVFAAERDPFPSVSSHPPRLHATATRSHTGKKPPARPADRYLRSEFADATIRIEPAAAQSIRSPEARSQKTLKRKVPLRGYGTFEGVILVPPANHGGLVLVEPAAATAPADTAQEGQIPKDLTETEEDPFEPVNRFFFRFNEMLDHLIVEPAARIYHRVLPEPVRDGVANAVRNLGSPIILANDILQGNRERAANTAVRFMVNSTIGLAGFVDAAGYMGVPYHQEDFGQTLAVWGAGPGPYMVVPILGPSNPRDLAGKLVDTAFNPLTWILLDNPVEQRLAPTAAQLIVGRDAILDDYAYLRKTSPDLYASVRDIYGQVRQTEIANGDVTGEPIPGITTLPPTTVITTVNPF